MAGPLPQGVLETLLREDGVELPSTDKPETMIRCFVHDDTTASMSVNLDKGVYHCHGCGVSGNPWQYMLQIRRVARREAIEVLTGMGWTSERFEHAMLQDERQKARAKGTTAHRSPEVIRRYYEIDAIAEHEYRDADGKLIGVKTRFPQTPENKKKRVPKIMPHVPAAGGGYWLTTPWSPTIPAPDRTINVPLYHVEEVLNSDPKQQIWIVEGEKCVDAVLAMKDFPKWGHPPCTCIYNMSSLHNCDMKPLAGRSVLLIADRDEKGRKNMRELGKLLANKVGCRKVRFVLPVGEDGHDVADIIPIGGWPALKKYLEEAKFQDYGEVFRSDEDVLRDRIEEKNISLGDNEHYSILGRSDSGHVVVRTTELSQVYYLTPQQLNQASFLTDLAPLDFWREVCGDRQFTNQGARLLIIDQIIRNAAKKGIVSIPHMMIGRGAFCQEGQYYYHMGDHVLTQDGKGVLNKRLDIQDVATRILRPRPGISVNPHPKAKAYCKEMAEALFGYRWQELEHGKVFIGWLVTSLIGGALPFRPMIWLTASAGSGKSFLLDPVVKGVMGNALMFSGDNTEAGIVEAVKDDSLPIWLDEFEPTLGKEDRQEGIMSLIRQMTSVEAMRVRGGPQKDANVTPRASMCLTSVHQRHLNEATSQRVVSIRLSREGVKDWPKLRKQIVGAVEPSRTAAIRHRIIEYTPHIVRLAEKFGDTLLANGYSTRASQIYGALSAGASFLFDQEVYIRPLSGGSTVRDEWRPVEVLLTTLLSVDGGRKTTLGEQVSALLPSSVATSADKVVARSILGQYGLKYREVDAKCEPPYNILMVATGSQAIKAVFKGSEFERVNLTQCFQGLDGVDMNNNFRISIGGHRHHSVCISLDKLREVGFLTDEDRA